MVKKPNKTNQPKDLIKMVRSKSICPKWHFGQIGHEGKKTMISCNVMTIFVHVHVMRSMLL